MNRRFMQVVVCALLCSSWLYAAARTHFVEPSGDRVVVTNAFHIVGVPGVKRNARVDVEFGPTEARFMREKKTVLVVPYSRMTRMQILDGTRTYGKATYASVLAFGLPGALTMMSKNHVDTLVIDFVNERGGQMGLIVQVPQGRGAQFRDQLRKHEVAVDEPAPLPDNNTAKKAGE